MVAALSLSSQTVSRVVIKIVQPDYITRLISRKPRPGNKIKYYDISSV